MAVGQYFQALSSYDLLGNLVPGSVGTAVILGFTSNPPLPQSIGGITLYAAGAFVLGSVIQAYASRAVGKPRSFVRTISTTEQLPNLTSSDDSQPNDINTDEIRADEKASGESPDYSDINSRSKLCSIMHALLGPIIWPITDKYGKKLDDTILINRIWTHLVDTHQLKPNTTEFGVLYHLMASRLDDVQSPSRALRMQAIRNFNRGMWLTSWGTFVLVAISIILDQCLDKGDRILSGYKYARPAYFDFWTPTWSLVILSLSATLVFWWLYRSSEEDYIEYLFTDYAVSIAESKDDSSKGE